MTKIQRGFIRHLPCPKCGSKDNLAEYEDHFWCFGCRYHKNKDDLESLRARVSDKEIQVTSVDVLETTPEIPIKPLKWLLSFGITLKEVVDNNITWNSKDQLLVLLNKPGYWQARCFGNQKVKYMSKGEKPLTIYGKGDTIVLVEDILSAIKVARLSPNYCSSPLLGCSIHKDTIQSLQGKFKSVRVWLDRDKAIEAIKIAKQFRERGVESDVIITEKDPKEYSKEELFEWLKSK